MYFFHRFVRSFNRETIFSRFFIKNGPKTVAKRYRIRRIPRLFREYSISTVKIWGNSKKSSCHRQVGGNRRRVCRGEAEFVAIPACGQKRESRVRYFGSWVRFGLGLARSETIYRGLDRANNDSTIPNGVYISVFGGLRRSYQASTKRKGAGEGKKGEQGFVFIDIPERSSARFAKIYFRALIMQQRQQHVTRLLSPVSLRPLFRLLCRQLIADGSLFALGRGTGANDRDNTVPSSMTG